MAEHAIQIMEKTETGSYNFPNMEKLRAIFKKEERRDKQVALISIAGAFRKGKSFMLNLIVNYLEWLTECQRINQNFVPTGKEEWLNENTKMDKFEWKCGTKSNTNGIHLWSKPYMLRAADGEEVAVFLMDTQGTFDHNSSVKDCTNIFAMSTLLSSLQIFNVSKQIQENDLNNLCFFAKFASLVSNSCQQHRNKLPTAPQIFQRLLFLVRDWQNSNQNEYGYEGGASYLNSILEIKDKNNQKKELQGVRENLRSTFEQLDCFLMPFPGENIASNNKSEVFGNSQPTFTEQVKKFVFHIFSNIEPKKIGGYKFTCEMLLNLLKTHMKNFDLDELPTPKTICESTAAMTNAKAEEKARILYNKLIKDVGVSLIQEFGQSYLDAFTDVEALETFQNTAVEAAIKEFNSKPIFGDISDIVYRENLTKHFSRQYEDLKKIVERNIERQEKRQKLKEEQLKFDAEVKKKEEQMANLEAFMKLHHKDQKKAMKKKLRKAMEDGEKLEKKLHEEKKRSVVELEESKKNKEKIKAQGDQEKEKFNREQQEEKVRIDRAKADFLRRAMNEK